MVRIRKKPVELRGAVLAARAAHHQAREQFRLVRRQRKATDADWKALWEARDALHAAVVAEKRERFLRLSATREFRARMGIQALRGLAQPKSYSYTAQDIIDIEQSIVAVLNQVTAELLAALVKTPKQTMFD